MSILKNDIQWDCFIVPHIYKRIELDKELENLIKLHGIVISCLNNIGGLDLLEISVGSFLWWVDNALNCDGTTKELLDELNDNIEMIDNRAKIEFINSNTPENLKRLINLCKVIEEKKEDIKKHNRKCPRFSLIYRKYLSTIKKTELEYERMYIVQNYFFDLIDQELNKRYWVNKCKEREWESQHRESDTNVC